MFGGEESWAESFKLLEPSMESDFIELTSEFVDIAGEFCLRADLKADGNVVEVEGAGASDDDNS